VIDVGDDRKVADRGTVEGHERFRGNLRLELGLELGLGKPLSYREVRASSIRLQLGGQRHRTSGSVGHLRLLRWRAVLKAHARGPLTKDFFTAVANIKSQKKRILTNAKAHERNKAVRSELKTRVKVAVRTATAEPGTDVSADALRLAIKRLDKAATKGIIHKNQAANRKSSLMKRIAKLSA
jgi:small subunit ribosomal protein S20